MATPTAIVAYLALFAADGLSVPVRESAGRLAGAAAAAERGEAGSLRVRRADDRLELRAVRPAVLRGRAAVHHLRRGSGVLLSVGGRVRQGDAAGVAEHAGVAAASMRRSPQASQAARSANWVDRKPTRSRTCASCGVAERTPAIDASGRAANGRAQLALTSLCRHRRVFRRADGRLCYVWKRGDLDWVRAVTRRQRGRCRRPPPPRDAWSRVSRSCRRRPCDLARAPSHFRTAFA